MPCGTLTCRPLTRNRKCNTPIGPLATRTKPSVRPLAARLNPLPESAQKHHGRRIRIRRSTPEIVGIGSEPMNGSIAFAETLEQPGFGGLAARGLLDELVGFHPSSQPVNPPTQPVEQPLESTLSDVLGQRRYLTTGGRHQLRRVHRAESVGWKVSDQTGTPVNVLEHSARVVRRCIPKSRSKRSFQAAGMSAMSRCRAPLLVRGQIAS